MAGNANLTAVIQYRAGRAMRKDTGADMFSEWHQKPVNVDPIGGGDDGFKLLHTLLRCCGCDNAPPVRYPVYMDIHADGLLFSGNTQHQVGAFGTDTFDRSQYIEIGR